MPPYLPRSAVMGFSHSPITLTVSKRRPPSTLGGSENNITFVSVKILYSKSNQIFVFAEKKIYFEFDETLFHSHAISVSVEVTNIPNHSDYHNIEEIEGGGDPCQKLVLTSTDI